jgi:hypothetical protein
VSDAELFTRLFYFGTVHLRMTSEEFWLCPLGLFLDLWACHRQFLGVEKAKAEQSIDEALPLGLL